MFKIIFKKLIASHNKLLSDVKSLEHQRIIIKSQNKKLLKRRKKLSVDINIRLNELKILKDK